MSVKASTASNLLDRPSQMDVEDRTFQADSEGLKMGKGEGIIDVYHHIRASSRRK